MQTDFAGALAGAVAAMAAANSGLILLNPFSIVPAALTGGYFFNVSGQHPFRILKNWP